MPINAGSYSVLSNNNTPVAFWPLAPGTSVEAATTFRPPLVAPVSSVSVFDIVIQMSQDNIVTKTEAAPSPPLAGRTTLEGTAVTSMPLHWDDAASRRIHICFAVAIPDEGVPRRSQFEGTLRLKASYLKASGQTANCVLDVALRIGPRQRCDDLFIFFVVHPVPPQRYCWVKLRAVEINSNTAVACVNVKAAVLRDNFSNGFTNINRQVELETNREGYASCEERTTLALPTGWPIIFRASVPSHPAAVGYMPRAHMLRFTEAHLQGNTQDTPFSPDSIQLQRLNTTRLANRRFLLDPGHGVVYGPAAPRSGLAPTLSRTVSPISYGPGTTYRKRTSSGLGPQGSASSSRGLSTCQQPRRRADSATSSTSPNGVSESATATSRFTPSPPSCSRGIRGTTTRCSPSWMPRIEPACSRSIPPR
jgi:hypothetical protein